jgi:hypothetical protein
VHLSGAPQILLFTAPALAAAILRGRLNARTLLAGVRILAGLAVSLARARLPAEEVA